jgi:hypothetical protein
MPKSRKRLRPKRRGRTKLARDPLALDRMFDEVAKAPHAGAPPVLYHYTTWEGARGIVASQRFWATAHDCTNDVAELVSADSVIIEVAKGLQKIATGAAGEVLSLFVEGYANLQVTKVVSICLVCFSVARDDESQWRNYGDKGHGVCLGIRVLNEPGPKEPPSALVKVDYSESSWRSDLTKHFCEVCSLLSRVSASRKNCELGLSALNRIAAFASIAAKRPEWAVEREFRHVTLVRQNFQNQMKEREVGGKTKRFLPVSLRADGRRIAFSEIILGSNRNAQETRGQLTSLLVKHGYKVGDLEYPEVTVSVIPAWNSSPTTTNPTFEKSAPSVQQGPSCE